MSAALPHAGTLTRYGWLGAPLAFAALPLYVLLPAHHAQEWGLSLAGLGALLLAVRLADALIDPWFGQVVDRLWSHSGRAWRALLMGASGILALSFALMWWAPASLRSAPDTALLWIWVAFTLLITTWCYSLLSVLHQAAGAREGGGDAAQARWASAREAAALLGVVAASVLPSTLGFGVTSLTLAVLLWIGVVLLRGLLGQPGLTPAAARPREMAEAFQPAPAAWSPWRNVAFRRLMTVFVVNGLASAVPATLVLFFIRDRLQAPQDEGMLLAIYFLAAVLSLPLWLKAVGRWGLERVWASGMALALLAFIFAARLGAGDGPAFACICAATGVALGADLVAPSALLVRAITQAGHQGQGEGRYFGWWALLNKANLALAAGLALPLLSWWGYVPGTTEASGLQALSALYALLPSGLKLLALMLCWTLLIRRNRS